jgi:hypothetical protein
MLSQENKEILIKRLKSLAWRTGSVVAVAILAFISENVGLWDIPVSAQMFIGLIAGEITKVLNSRV